jgi:hypothetical protein
LNQDSSVFKALNSGGQSIEREAQHLRDFADIDDGGAIISICQSKLK